MNDATSCTKETQHSLASLPLAAQLRHRFPSSVGISRLTKTVGVTLSDSYNSSKKQNVKPS